MIKKRCYLVFYELVKLSSASVLVSMKLIPLIVALHGSLPLLQLTEACRVLVAEESLL